MKSLNKSFNKFCLQFTQILPKLCPNYYIGKIGWGGGGGQRNPCPSVLYAYGLQFKNSEMHGPIHATSVSDMVQKVAGVYGKCVL